MRGVDSCMARWQKFERGTSLCAHYEHGREVEVLVFFHVGRRVCAQ